MKFKQTAITLGILFFGVQIIAQSSIEDFVNEGIQYHDAGDYDKAIEVYEQALKIDSKSPLANYEIALSYFSKGDYNKAIKYSDIVLKQNKAHLIPAYITKGSALDQLGKTKESIKVFEKAIKKTEGHFLLYYNLALNFFKLDDLENAEENAEENVLIAISSNPNHSSSHFMLALIHNQKGNPVQTLLAAHYFLFLEPNTNKSVQAYQLVQENFGGNVSKDPNKSNTINITLSSSDDDEFRSAELMISMLEASKTLEENEEKTEFELFVENTGSFFKYLGEIKKKRDKEIWWTFYTSFFYNLAKSDHLTTYCNYISQSINEESYSWLIDNQQKLVDFDEWLKNN